MPGTQDAIIDHHLLAEIEQQRNGVFGSRLGWPIGSIHDQDAAPGCLGEVNAIYSNARTSDNTQARADAIHVLQATGRIREAEEKRRAAQAMFDEMDEGTAIFKCTNDPPVGESRFLTLEGLPSDHYLWLAGIGRKLLRGEIEATEELPQRKSKTDKKPKLKGSAP